MRGTYVAGKIRLVLVLPLLAGLVACDSAVTASAPFDEARCAVPSSLRSLITVQSFDQEALIPALQHAAGPMTAELGAGEMANELRRSIERLGTETGARLHDTQCRLLIIAASALAEMPATAETAPDRAGIQLVLALLAGALTESAP